MSIPVPLSFAKSQEFPTATLVLVNAAKQPLNPPSEDEIRRAQLDDPIYRDIVEKLKKGEPLGLVGVLPVWQFFLGNSSLLYRKATPRKIKGC